MTLHLVVIVVIVLGVLAAVVLVARSRLRPVRLLGDAVQHVVETRDFQPVTVRNATGEVARLASWFNRLLRMVARMRERQTRLVLDASHELRNPLTSLRTNVDLLAVDLRSDRLSPDQRGEIVGDVQAQLSELSGLVTDLTHLARDEDEVRPQPLDVREIVEAAVARVQRRGQDRVFDVELQPLFTMGHEDSLARVVVNLLDNAVKWSPSGGTIRVRLDGNRLRVSDEGPGIPDADLPYVFDRFFRGQTGRGTPGTGLGLSIVAKAVEDHGGTVRAGRAESGGAEFTVQLPGVTTREALASRLQEGEAVQDATARSVEAAAAEAAGVAERAVRAAADRARQAAAGAQQARAAATTRTASVMAETVRQRALAVQDHADVEAREVAAAADRAASRVASEVVPGREAEAQRAAVRVARVTTDAAAATAKETALVAVVAACAAASAALKAATEAADAAMVIELEVRSTARAVQDTADAAATRVATEAHHAAELVSGSPLPELTPAGGSRGVLEAVSLTVRDAPMRLDGVGDRHADRASEEASRAGT